LLTFGDASLTWAWTIGGLAVLLNGAVAGALSIFGATSLAAVILVLYHRTVPAEVRDPVEESAAPVWHRWMWTGGVATLALVGLLSGSALVSDLDLDEPVELTAHRAGATYAPENSLAALKQAIIDRADWAEIDVQLTSDNELVVMHDTDLARIGGGNRQVGDVTLAEIQQLDIGTGFDGRFAGEKVPTFRELLSVARGKVKLNVELKPHGKRDEVQLAESVVAAIREAQMVGECRICSQSFNAIQSAKAMETSIPIGLIIATAIGDPTRLPVDFLMVKANLATESFVERAHAAGIRVHAWTVNNPNMVAPLLDASVDNLITDDVFAIRAKIEEIDDLTPVQRLLLRTRHALSRK
jgi:glycerophosphoryl diester phosphodiesterase